MWVGSPTTIVEDLPAYALLAADEFSGLIFSIGLSPDAPVVLLVRNPRDKEERLTYTAEAQLVIDPSRGATTEEIHVVLSYYRNRLHTTDLLLRCPPEADFAVQEWGFVLAPDGAAWEWFESERPFYTYRTTATDSDKYYLGASHVKKDHATAEDCLEDGYFGSGSPSKKNKFRNWRARHNRHLVKKVLELFLTRAAAYEAEAVLVGDSWKNDPHCLNGGPGGLRTAPSPRVSTVSLKNCPTHGESKHQRDSCFKCLMAIRDSTRNCTVHGPTSFVGDLCRKCYMAEAWTVKTCEIHGAVKHYGDYCRLCHITKSLSTQDCLAHGQSIFQGSQCCRCLTEARLSTRLCHLHGYSIHNSKTCMKCSAAVRVEIIDCSLHGGVAHFDGQCMTCRAQDSVSMRNCSIHGQSKHKGSACYKCFNDVFEERPCPNHGLTLHRGNSCARCATESFFTEADCETHGHTIFRGEKCNRCIAAARNSFLGCPTHGPLFIRALHATGVGPRKLARLLSVQLTEKLLTVVILA